jgi:hypothetical protein
MSRPQPGERRTTSHPRKAVGTFVAFVLSLAVLIALPQAAQAADVVDVPDANFKAALNTAIAATDGTTRTPDQDITPAEAQAVTTIDTGVVEGAPIATLTGLEAFTNVTTLTLIHFGSTVTDLRPIGSLNKLTSLTAWFMPFSSLDGLESVATLKYLDVQGNDQLADVSALSHLTQLTDVTVRDSPPLKDISALAASKATLQSLIVEGGAVEDIDFLEGFKSAVNIVLSNNRIEDVSVFSTFDDSYALNDSTNNALNLSGNRIPDFSPVVAFYAIRGLGIGPRVSVSSQSIYVGPYDAANGVTVPLKSGPNQFDSQPPATPTIEPGVGAYDAETGLLTSADPGAPFVQVSPSWTIRFSEAPDKFAALRVNEAESNGDAVNGDWVELYNPGSSALDLGGLVVADSDNTHKIVVPNGTKIPAKGYRAIRTDDPTVTGQFGLGSADSVRIFAPGTTDLASAPIDAYSWTEHATTTYGRTVPGAGRWTTTSGGTLGAVNTFATAASVTVSGDATSTSGSASLTATVAKPGGTDVATDATGTVVFAVDGTDVSGPVAVTDGTATWTATDLTGSPAGIAHQVTARYVAAGESDPYESSVPSADFTVTVTIGEFAGGVTLSTSAPVVCETITSDLSGITPVPDSVTYQWQQKRGSSTNPWADVPAGTGDSHTLTFTVADGQLIAPAYVARRLVATVSKAGYATKTFTSGETANVAAAPFLTKPAATLSSSTPKVGETITATHPKWTSCIPAELNFEIGYDYQWLRDGQPIAGASDTSVNGIGGVGPKQVSYTLTPAEAGHKISLRIRGGAPGMSSDGAVSPETAAVTAGAFATSPTPVIDNMSPKVGDKLTASTTPWSPVATFAYQWLRDGQPITGATSATYTAAAADADHALSVKATGTADGYASADKTSDATATVAKLAFTGARAPVIDDITPTEGDTLTATAAAWTPGAAFAWQWLRDGQPIPGATQATYPVVAGDVGHVLSARVTGTAAGYQAHSETSQPTAAVAAKPQAQAPAPANVTVTSKYAVKIKAAKGKKLTVVVAAKGVPAAALDTKATLKVAGIKGAYKVTLKNGKATVVLGAKAKALSKGTKIKVSLALPKLVFTTTTGTTTTSYTITKATDKVAVKLK